MGSAVTKETKNDIKLEEFKEKSQLIKLQIINEQLEQAKVATNAHTQMAHAQTQMAEHAKMINGFIAAAGVGVSTGLFFVAIDHLLRGTRFGRKFCVRLHLYLSPSRFFDILRRKNAII